MQSAAKPDTEYALFGGGVKGKYVSLTPGKEIVQTWALSSPSWPSGRYSTRRGMMYAHLGLQDILRP